MGVQRVLFSCCFLFLLTPLHAQVTIKEHLLIDPTQRPEYEVSSISNLPLLRLNGTILETTVPGVVVSGTLSVTPSDIPENTAYEVWVNVGGSAHLLKRLGTGYCDAPGNVSSPFPYTIEKCGVVAMSARTFVPAPWQWSCSPREGGIELPVVNGNSATLTASGTLWYTGFTATLTVTASLDESYLPAQIVVTPQRDSLECVDWSAVDVTVLDAHGNLFTGCSGSRLTGTASIRAKGEYAFLEWTDQIGTRINFDITNGRGVFLAVLDTSRGFIEGGADAAELRVEVEGKTGTASMSLFCAVPPPSVAIIRPGSDTTIALSKGNLPDIVFEEEHSPGHGEPFEPSITWEPGPKLSTAEYFETLTDSMVIPVRVVAENAGGTASDQRKITLQKSCDLNPPHYRQGDTLWATQPYDNTTVGIKTLGCALSCMAMAMTAFGDTVDPGTLNDWMKQRSFDEGGFKDDKVNWEAVRKHDNKAANLLPRDVDTSFSLASLDPLLRQCHLIIAKVFNPRSVEHRSEAIREEAKKKGNHWVLVIGKSSTDYTILDPGRGLASLSQYGRIFRYVQIAKN